MRQRNLPYYFWVIMFMKKVFQKRRIKAQTKLAKKFNRKAIFIPENHDWYNGSEGLKRDLGKNSFFLQNGCLLKQIDISEKNVLILVDTHWYLTNWDNHPTIVIRQTKVDCLV